VGKCYSIKSLDYKFLGMEGISPKCDKRFTEAQRKLIHLEELKTFVTAQGVAQGNIESRFNLKAYRAERLKRLLIGGGFMGEWSFINEDKDVCIENFLRNLAQYKNVREITIKLLRHPIEAQAALRIATCFAKFVHLEHLIFDYIGY